MAMGLAAWLVLGLGMPAVGFAADGAVPADQAASVDQEGAGAGERASRAAALARAVADIDRVIEARWQADGIVPAPPADDAEFLRRAWLDLCGRIPPVWVVREFLADESPDKRRRVIDELLEGPLYVTHFTDVWRNILLPEVTTDPQLRFLVPSFDAWLRQKLAANTPYDRMAAELLTTSLAGVQADNPFPRNSEVSPVGYYQAKQIKPENLAASTSRIFLGVRLECAQCHDHPFDSWKREEFWSFAVFFAGMQRTAEGGVLGAVTELFDRQQLTIPETEITVKAAFLDGSAPEWKYATSPRATLAQWTTSPENPYFVRTAVNRMWAHLMGVGIVEPVDDFGPSNEPSHPELLDVLGQHFVDADFDVKFLTRAIAASRAYQLTSRQTDASQSNSRYFARMAVKGLTPEQLFHSLAEATGFYEPYDGQNPFLNRNGSPQAEFRELFGNSSESTTEQTTSILQALAMMNGDFTADATDLEQSRTLTAVCEFPLMTDAERIETLFLAALGRPPRADELERFSAYVATGGPTGQQRRALSDVFWALLNSSEFKLNH